MSDNNFVFLSATGFFESRLNGWQRVRELLFAAKTGNREKPRLCFCDNCRKSITTLPTAPRDTKKIDDLATNFEHDHVLDEVRYAVMHKKSEVRYVSSIF